MNFYVSICDLFNCHFRFAGYSKSSWLCIGSTVEAREASQLTIYAHNKESNWERLLKVLVKALEARYTKVKWDFCSCCLNSRGPLHMIAWPVLIKDPWNTIWYNSATSPIDFVYFFCEFSFNLNCDFPGNKYDGETSCLVTILGRRDLFPPFLPSWRL